MLRSLRASSSFRATNSSLRIASFSDSLFFSRSGMRVKSEPAWLQGSDNTMFSPTILLTCQDLESVTVSLLIPPCMDKQTLKKNFDSASWDCACIWLLIEPKTKRHSNNWASMSPKILNVTTKELNLHFCFLRSLALHEAHKCK